MQTPNSAISCLRRVLPPLMIAAMIGRGDIADVLLQRGANINMQDSKSGWTALMQATFHRYLKQSS